MLCAQHPLPRRPQDHSKGWGGLNVRFHAFRRFRQAVLEKSEVRQLLIDYWLGHDNPDMSSRYGKQLTEDVEFRQEWAERVDSASFYPTFRSRQTLIALRALQILEKSETCIANA